ncbi:MAG: UvrD-helicase domain-containing protein [Lentisphaerae bacterium]|nr:UvrD-helicase domain-containing protein [Lentisphaerota bacterium]
MQSRIREKLLDKGKSDEAQRVFDGLIGTVNSVCGQLLNQYAIEAGLPPQLDVIPEENATPIFEAAISRVIEKHAEQLNEVGSRLNLSPLKQNPYQKTSDWKSDVKTIVDLARSNNLGKEQLEQCAEDSCKTLKTIFTASQKLSLDDIAARIKPCAEFKAKAKGTKDTIDKIKSFLRSPTWHVAGSLADSKYAKTKDPDFPIELLESVQDELLSSQELYADLCTMVRGVFACAAEALQEYDEYKKAWGLIDFVDQESKVLHLLQDNAEFGDLLRDRLSQVLVDEFQDTSPIQLALFLKLNEFAKNGSVWVGDPKQAIYGFRGTDPELMHAAANAIKNVEQLPYSWRSQENLVSFANEVFTKAFSNTPPEEVQLAIPPERAAEAAGGQIEAWHLCAKNNSERWQALAAGIAGLIRDDGVLPSDIGVLMKTNSHCAELAKALKAWNIQASAPPGELMAAPECQLILAAYRYCIDPHDTVALATILALSGDFPDWLQGLQKAKNDWLNLSDEERKGKDFLAELHSLPLLQKLQKPGDETPLEILEQVITAFELDLRLQKMPFPDCRLSNLEELRRLCRQYMEQAQLERRAATPAGFAAMLLNDDKIKAAPGFGRNSVNVLTYHKAKGLEWPIVILESLDSDEKASAFDISIKQAQHFDLQNPLQDRSLHYWPNFCANNPFSSLKEALETHSQQIEAETRACEEDKRLFYVGLTRAKERLIFAIVRKEPTKEEKKKNAPDRLDTSWLERLSDDLSWDFPLDAGAATWKVGDKDFELHTKILAPPEILTPLASPPVFTDSLPAAAAAKTQLPARLAPSQLPKQTGTATLMREWKPYLQGLNCKQDENDLLGNAFHAFFALNPQADQKQVAERLLANWQQQNAVKPETVITACQRLYDWVNSEFPGSSVTCEVPMTWRNDHGQLFQGFIDMLIETSDGYVIVDHKTTIKPDPLAEAASHAAQLEIYRNAVEKATSKKVSKTIIHFPLMGKCVEVEG